MTVGACRDCGKEVSDEARACPHCGKPLPLLTGGQRSAKVFVSGMLAAFLGPVGLWYLGHWAAGFAWLLVGAALISTMGLPGGVLTWVGIFIHTVFADPR